jgi:hypothetical protein
MGMAILSDEHSDRNIAKSAWVVANTGPGDMVVTSDSAIFVRYLRYESSANVVYLTEAAVRRDDLVEYLKQKQGPSTQVFLTADVLNVPDHIRHRSEHAFNALVDLATALEKDTVLVVFDEFGGIYRYQGDIDQL